MWPKEHFIHVFIYRGMLYRDLFVTLFATVFPLFSYSTNATPTAINTLPLLSTNGTINTLGMEDPVCFTKDSHPGIGFTNSHDCYEALRLIYMDPARSQMQEFSRGTSLQRKVINVPHGWQYKECVIYVSCENFRDSANFTYLDVARRAAPIIKECVDRVVKTPKYGGLVQEVRGAWSFYVAVGRPKGIRRGSSDFSAGIRRPSLGGTSMLPNEPLAGFGEDGDDRPTES